MGGGDRKERTDKGCGCLHKCEYAISHHVLRDGEAERSWRR